MTLLPARFLTRIAYSCHYLKRMPREDDRLLDLPDVCRVDNLADLDQARNFADVRLAWNDLGIGFQAEVRGKEQPLRGHESQLRASDGATLWIDTRDSRASHRASRYCHQFHLLPTGGGPDHDEPVALQGKINRALQDAPLCPPDGFAFRAHQTKQGYILEAFFPAGCLHGFDPEQNRRLGVYYAIRDAELGDQVLSVDADFPYWEDPSLWSVLELNRPRR